MELQWLWLDSVCSLYSLFSVLFKFPFWFHNFFEFFFAHFKLNIVITIMLFVQIQFLEPWNIQVEAIEVPYLILAFKIFKNCMCNKLQFCFTVCETSTLVPANNKSKAIKPLPAFLSTTSRESPVQGASSEGSSNSPYTTKNLEIKSFEGHRLRLA